MLRIENVKKSYGKYRALDGLNMEIKPGALYGFVGPNGAGKTTTIKILAGLLAPDEGRISIDGMDMSTAGQDLKGKIGYVPDHFGVYDNLTVWEYMEFFAACYGIEGLTGRKRCEFLLDQVGLERRRDFYVDGLSRGMKQRLCLARALVHEPKLLILDEPSAGLDPAGRRSMLENIRNYHKEKGTTVVMVSHSMDEVAENVDRIVVLANAGVVMSGTPHEVFSRAQELMDVGLNVPQVTQVAMELKRQGVDIDPAVYTVADLRAALAALKGGRR